MSADEKLVERLRQIVATFNANGTAPSYAAAIDRAASALEASYAREAALAAELAEANGYISKLEGIEHVAQEEALRVSALAAEIATLREVLKPFAERANFNGLSQVVSLGACQRARAALRQEGKP